jgi:uncharacterized protein YyaL (SSP411 family)
MYSKTFENNTYPTLLWLKKSIDATGQKGSSAFYSRIRLPLRGWDHAYPETTGYIIPTLFNYHSIFKEDWIYHYAIKCADWLCEIQYDSGAYPELYGQTGKASVFNTGQIIFGLVRAFEETNDRKYFIAFQKATHWLSDSLDENGLWKKGLYVSDFVPSYNTRVIWAMLRANQHLKDDEIKKNAQKALTFYLNKIQPNCVVKDWSFAPNEPAFTHTIAYTIRGFLESALLLKDDSILQKATQLAEKLAEIWQVENRFAGTYDENWKGDYSFVCVTGNAQISIIFSRLFQVTKEEKWKTLGTDIITTPPFKWWDNSSFPTYHLKGGFARIKPKGAIPGSVPFWGKYMHFKYPNWAAKFYLDAFLEVEKNTKDKF